MAYDNVWNALLKQLISKQLAGNKVVLSTKLLLPAFMVLFSFSVVKVISMNVIPRLVTSKVHTRVSKELIRLNAFAQR